MTIKTKKYEDEDIHFCMTDKACGPDQKSNFKLHHKMWFKKGNSEWVSTAMRSEEKAQQLLNDSFYCIQAWKKIMNPKNW